MSLEKIIKRHTKLAKSLGGLFTFFLGVTIANPPLEKDDQIKRPSQKPPLTYVIKEGGVEVFEGTENVTSTYPIKRIDDDYDDDSNLDFVWTAPVGSFDRYNVYSSENGLGYKLDGTTQTERYRLASAKEDYAYRIKLCAVTSDGREGPFSPESDKVTPDLTNPTAPIIGSCEESRLVDIITYTIGLIRPSSDRHFMCYQKYGGPYSEWTSTNENESTGFKFVFTPDFYGLYELQIRGVDKALRTGEPASATVTVPVRGSQNPGYWEYDTDGDSQSNFEEYTAGTDIYDSDSYFYAKISDSSQGKVISWQGVAVKTYQVYRTDNISGGWQQLGPEIFVDGEREVQLVDTENSEKTRYYKVGVK